jgi:hypothetical protein
LDFLPGCVRRKTEDFPRITAADLFPGPPVAEFLSDLLPGCVRRKTEGFSRITAAD